MRKEVLHRRIYTNELRHVVSTLILKSVVGVAVATVVAFHALPAAAIPSGVEYEGPYAIWKVGDKPVWRFPKANSALVTAMSDRFNALYKKGFSLRDLRVAKKDGEWSLCIGENLLAAASPEYCVEGKRNAKTVALLWMSRVYDAIGKLHAQELTAKYKIKGGYELTSKVSWFGGRFIGRKFANGEQFTEGHLAAAAQSLPFGTLVRITAPASGRSVVVRVTDRFAGHKGRALDISQAAAEVLGIQQAGVAKVQIQVIGRVERVGGG